MVIRILTRGGPRVNAIDQASANLARALITLGHDSTIEIWSTENVRTIATSADLVVVPYNPFMWGRWGFAPKLVLDVLRLRFRRVRPRLAILVHEPYIPIEGWKSLLMGGWQRFQLVVLLAVTDIRFASIEVWASSLSRIRTTHHLPSGSNVPDQRGRRTEARAQLGVGERLVLATLDTGHPSHLTSLVESTLGAVVLRGLEATYLHLGAGAASLVTPDGVPVITPGRVDDEQLGAFVAAADIFLIPLIDGVSTRRTSFMAAICEGVAVVATIGSLTDPMLRRQNIAMADVGDPRRFADLVVELAQNAELRRGFASAGRALFESQFTWESIAQRLLDGYR